MPFRHHHTPLQDTNILLGDPRNAIRSMFVPILVALAVVEVNVFVDNIWCSNLGVDAMSAISVVMTLYYFFSHSAAGLGIGINVAVSNRIGAGDIEGAGSRSVQLLMATALVTVLLIPFLFLGMDVLITAIGGDGMRGLCREYLVPLFLMSPFVVLSGIVSGMLRGEGAAGKSTVVNVVTAVTNIVLDPVFIFGLDMGVAGASVATGLSCVVAVVLGLWYFLSGRTSVKLCFRGFRFDGAQLKDVMSVGVPQMLEQNIGSIANLCLVLVIVGCGGSLGLALYNVPWKVVHLVMVPVCAFGAAMIPVVSAARGQNDPEKMRAALVYTMKTVVLIGVAMMLFLFVAAEPLMWLFSYGGDMGLYRDKLVEIMWIYALFVPCYGLMAFSSSLLSGLKKSGISAINAFVRNAILILTTFVCGQIGGMDLVYWGVMVAEVLGAVYMVPVALLVFRNRYRAMKCPLHAGPLVEH
ncbi:MAG: MATE family efflux transporter [archaeon]|nr:MATE family efflux transporter [archaeon]